MDTNMHAACLRSANEGRKSVVSTRAFSLVEMMVVMSLLSVIVLGLYSVFNQTQRALIANTAQVDVLENGRVTLDLVSREIEQAVAWGHPATNLPNLSIQFSFPTAAMPVEPYTMTLNDKTIRTNLIQECFFLSRSNNWWLGNGFFLALPTNGTALTTKDVALSGVGTLYRFSEQPYNTNLIPWRFTPVMRLLSNDLVRLTRRYAQAHSDATIAFPIAEGIAHFSLRPYDAAGRLMTNNYNGKDQSHNWTHVWTNFYRGTNYPGGILASYWNTNIECLATSGILLYNEYNWNFYDNSLPAYLELELGIVKPYILQRMRTIPSAVAQRDYLKNQPGAVNIFHKMIPLRNAQP